VTDVQRHPRVVVGLGAALAALGFAIFWFRPFAPTDHGPGEGALTAPGDPWTMGLDPAPADRWTLGIQLCAAEPPSVPVLDSVTPTGTVGSFDFLGASMRRFAPTNAHPPLLSVTGYPPDIPDTLVPVAGYAVQADCSREAEFADYNELVLGIGRRGDSGGGWLGEAVRYHVGGRQFVLRLDYVILVCGPSVPQQYC
jgi:hypothetical protein